jgi:DNA-binding transcriptional MerR regulator
VGPLLSIGEVAQRSGLSTDTLRYYESERLIPAPARDGGGRRRYPPQVLDALGVVRTLRLAGFGVADVRRFMAVKAPGSSVEDRLAAARAALEGFHQQLDERFRSLDEARALLRGLGAELDDAGAATDASR